MVVTTVRIALGAAALWSLALVVAAVTVPLYSGDTVTADSSGASSSTDTTATLVEVNGWWGLVVASLPLAASVVVAVLLLGVRRRPAVIVALVLVVLLGIVTVLSLLTIGAFIAPVTAGLGLAVLVALAGPTEAAP